VPNGGHSAKRTPLDAVRPPTNLCRVSAFAECRSLLSARHSAKASLPSAIFCRVRRSTKQVFAECPKFGTRQRFLHSANHVFPVVRGGQRSGRGGSIAPHAWLLTGSTFLSLDCMPCRRITEKGVKEAISAIFRSLYSCCYSHMDHGRMYCLDPMSA